jgi:hypothetical protein
MFTPAYSKKSDPKRSLGYPVARVKETLGGNLSGHRNGRRQSRDASTALYDDGNARQVAPVERDFRRLGSDEAATMRDRRTITLKDFGFAAGQILTIRKINSVNENFKV